jgi:hypothetical protein
MEHSVITTARKYVGMKELPNNGGFQDPVLQAVMTKAGHKKGESWCAYFTEAMFCEAFPDKEPVYRKLFSGGAVATFANFAAAKYATSKNKPKPGDLVIWRRIKDGVLDPWRGHAGIVEKVINENRFVAIEGNGSAQGSANGDRVVIKERTLTPIKTGLVVLGFVTIHP